MANRIVLITGANRGIGFTILEGLAKRFPSDQFFLGTRALDNGEKAVQQLQSLGVTAERIHLIELDVTSDDSIKAAETLVREKFGRLDVLINNAGIANPVGNQNNVSSLRTSLSQTYNTNVFGPLVTSQVFLPLLKESSSAMIINLTSSLGSITRRSEGAFKHVTLYDYCSSKAALNMVTAMMAEQEPNITIYTANPGHCATGLNRFTGPKDPQDGAKVVIELVAAVKGRYKNGGFYEMEAHHTEPTEIAW
ncbi:MAG: hypothetical protein MMC33_009249 [Icmadophila ericetorum]|nr:hypothetical protein [Icmadophila ericetorum]